jgi:hypothetical protein
VRTNKFKPSSKPSTNRLVRIYSLRKAESVPGKR